MAKLLTYTVTKISKIRILATYTCRYSRVQLLQRNSVQH